MSCLDERSKGTSIALSTKASSEPSQTIIHKPDANILHSMVWKILYTIILVAINEFVDDNPCVK